MKDSDEYWRIVLVEHSGPTRCRAEASNARAAITAGVDSRIVASETPRSIPLTRNALMRLFLPERWSEGPHWARPRQRCGFVSHSARGDELVTAAVGTRVR